MKLNFTISELLKSDVANRAGIKNIPADIKTLDNLMELIVSCLQPIRNYIGKPMVINSGFRTPVLNNMVGGVANSQHIQGYAADFVIQGLTIDEIIQKIKASGVEYDQLIHEGSWVHISYVKGKNRKQFLKV
ncbi:MAG: D-Ala-D-Ala carboxypeptidase family metallohydrolase [Candidatus Gastranaerophilales bacterium]|nr:D-Ala-D-Ala carboxypeptidase family metallohydrolase [Candidatus Gastranaerophilales bacterium]MCM1072256.1 D-Ala-D-Ala carboxypeptidase family metallohydrolase [Bacteroides sp.]